MSGSETLGFDTLRFAPLLNRRYRLLEQRSKLYSFFELIQMRYPRGKDGKTVLAILAGRQPKSNVWSLRERPIKVTVLDERKGQIGEFEAQEWQQYLWMLPDNIVGRLTVLAAQVDASGKQRVSNNDTIVIHERGPEVTPKRGIGGFWKTYRYLDGLPDNRVHAIYQDREENIWFGTQNGGVARFDGII